jgi:hypothetical protein
MNYTNGQVYVIRSHLTDKIYIGSTAQPLHKRLYQHKMNKAHDCTAREILKYGDAYIELIENYPCQSKKELNRREGHHIRNTENCVNRNIAGQTPQESSAKYYVAHRAEICEKRKAYYVANRDKIAESDKLNYVANRDKILERERQRYITHRAEIKEKQKQYRIAKRAELCEYQKEYRLANKAKISEQRKQLYAAKKLASQSAPSSEA